MVMHLVVLVVLLASAGTVQAQSLAELSRRIRADRAQRDAAGPAQPDKPPDLTKNVLTNADLYVYTIPPRPRALRTNCRVRSCTRPSTRTDSAPSQLHSEVERSARCVAA